MAYTTRRSGFTGPSAKIGGSTEYHQDLKLLEALPISERVKMLDAIALQNQAIGREIEFSNPAVSGKRWNLNADLSDKIDLLNRAASAHAHSKHPGWQSFDYYTPFKGKTRFDKGAVEDASIYLPVIAGGKVRRGSGGGYGYYSESLDPQGRVIARVGHGNIDRPEAETEVLIPSQNLNQPQAQLVAQEQVLKGEDFLSGYLNNMMKQNLISDILSPQQRSSSDAASLIAEMLQYAPQSPLANPLFNQ